MVRRYRRVQYLELTHGALLDAVLVSTYTDSHTPASSKTLPHPYAKRPGRYGSRGKEAARLRTSSEIC
jgi:hypothetical protein